MKALVVAPQPFFSPRGTPMSVYYRTLVMAEQGVQVDLLTYGQGEDVEIPGVRIIRIPAFRFLGPVRIGPSLLKLWLDLFLVIWTVALLVRRRYDFVHAHEESVFFLRLFKPIFRFKLLYDMHSSLPQQLGNFEFTRSGAIVGLFEALENTSLKCADVVITVCPMLRDYAVARMPDPSRQFLLENSIFDPVKLKDPGLALQVADDLPPLPVDRPVVFYAGTFEPYQGIDLLIRAFAEVRSHRPDAFLLMLGGTPEQVGSARDLVGELGLDSDSSVPGRVPMATAKRAMRDADVLVSPRSQGTNTPLKVYEQLASGIPLVATRLPTHTQVVDDSVCYLVEVDPRTLAQGILAALDEKGARDRIVENAQALYREKYSRRAYERTISRVLEALR